jgi:MoxR-like ATPase
VHAVAPSALRHRIAPSFEAEADGMDSDHIVSGIIARLQRQVPEDAS